MSTRNLVAMGAPRWARKVAWTERGLGPSGVHRGRVREPFGGSRLIVLATVLVLASAGAAGCVRIDGGAVELSWVLRTPEGRAVSDCGCSTPEVAMVRLHLALRKAGQPVPGATPCEGRAQCQFACQRHTGATPFDIPETQPDEMYLISVDTLDKDGAMLAGVGTPAPVLRAVVRGQPTDMGALLLVTECANECSGMNGQGVCARP